MPSKRLDPEALGRARELYRGGLSGEAAARKTGFAPSTLRNHLSDADRAAHGRSRDCAEAEEVSLPEPAAEAGGPGLPDAICPTREPLQADQQGWWLILGDLHLPLHDKGTILAAVEEARQKQAVGVLLNGDVMDCFSISPFFREPTRDRFIDEIEATRQFLHWLRSRLPKARIIFREGNHEFRTRRYIADRAAALYDLEEVHLPALLRLRDRGIEWVQDKRLVMLGKLATLHGHELRKGEGVNPARLAFLRTTCTVLVGHHHRTSEHHQRGLDGRHFASWSVGCACFLAAEYDPFNQWNHGYCMTEVGSDGWFSVHNRRVLQGRVV